MTSASAIRASAWPYTRTSCRKATSGNPADEHGRHVAQQLQVVLGDALLERGRGEAGRRPDAADQRRARARSRAPPPRGRRSRPASGRGPPCSRTRAGRCAPRRAPRRASARARAGGRRSAPGRPPPASSARRAAGRSPRASSGAGCRATRRAGGRPRSVDGSGHRPVRIKRRNQWFRRCRGQCGPLPRPAAFVKGDALRDASSDFPLPGLLPWFRCRKVYRRPGPVSTRAHESDKSVGRDGARG